MSDSPKNLYKKFLGSTGEKAVEKYLKKQGCKTLKRNYRTPFGEADLIVQDKDEIAFVEVKTRTGDGFGSPKDAVGYDKQRRYYQIAKFYALELGEEPNARFDVAEVDEHGEINYIKNAF